MLTTIFLHHSPLKPDVRPFMASLCAELTDEDIEEIANADYGMRAEMYRAVLTEVRAARAITREQAVRCHEVLDLTAFGLEEEQLHSLRYSIAAEDVANYRRVAFACAALLSISVLGEPYGLEPSDRSLTRLLYIAIAMGPERTVQAGQLLAAMIAYEHPVPATWAALLIAALASGSCTERQAGAMARAIRLVANRQGPGWYWQLDIRKPKIVVDKVEPWRVMLNRYCSSVGTGYSERSVRELRALESMLTPIMSL